MAMERFRVVILAGVAAIVSMTACGGGGDGGAAGSESSAISGNVAGPPASASAPVRESWIAWIAEEALGLARKAYARRSGVDGIIVTARGAGPDSAAVTDDSGSFDLPDAPTGDVRVGFDDGDCESEVEVPDVVEGSTVVLEDVNVDCESSAPARVAETFQGVVRNKPASPNGNLVVCVDTGTRIRTRVVKLGDAVLLGLDGTEGSFGDLDEGDLIEASGERSGQGAPSALDAETVQILAKDAGDFCRTGELPAPTPTPTIEPTPEPTPTEEGTPEA